MDKFARFVHRRYPHDKFIAVPELQKRGAFHFHFPISGWMPKEKLRFYHECWRKATRKYGGTFNISWHRRHGVSDSENAVRICNYLSKYLSNWAKHHASWANIVTALARIYSRRAYDTCSMPKRWTRPHKSSCH